MNWYAIYTKPKQEDIVSTYLERINIEVLNPKLKRKKFIQGRKKEVVVPLFPCYIFAKFKPELHYKTINYTRGVRKIVGFDNHPYPVADEIIDIIRSKEEDGYVQVQKSLKTGDMVVIKSGPFKDFIGMFEQELSGKERVIILLNTMSNMHLIIDRDMVERQI